MVKILSARISEVDSIAIDKLHQIIIKGYQVSENEIWGDDYQRISKDELIQFIKNGEILIAVDENSRVLGGIRFFNRSETTWAFGLFAVDLNEKGRGIGRQLIAEVEKQIKKQGGTKIEVEILRVKGFDVPQKNQLHDWYVRLGYNFVRSKDPNDLYNSPAKWSQLRRPSVFECFTKKL